MARDVDIGAEDIARADDRSDRDISASIAREMAWHAKLFDESWDEAMQATPREIDAFLSDAGRPGMVAGSRRAARLALLRCERVAVQVGRSTAAAGSTFGQALRELLVRVGRSARGSASEPMLVGLASFAMVTIAIHLILLDWGRGTGAAAAGVETDQEVSGVSWRQDGAGLYHDLTVRTESVGGNPVRFSPNQAAVVAGASAGRVVSRVNRPALLVAPLPAQALPLEGSASPQAAIAASAEPQAMASSEAGLAIVPLSVACSEAADKVDCTLTKPSTASRRVVLGDVLTARMRDWYAASAKLGGGMVCVIGPQAGSEVDCREVSRPAEWHSGLGGVPFETVIVGMESGAVRVKARRRSERPINP
jgi:hypothetical protein